MANAVGSREPNSFAWLTFGFLSAIVSAVILIVMIEGIGTGYIGLYYRSVEGILAMMLSSFWFFAAFYRIAKGFRRV